MVFEILEVTSLSTIPLDKHRSRLSGPAGPRYPLHAFGIFGKTNQAKDLGLARRLRLPGIKTHLGRVFIKLNLALTSKSEPPAPECNKTSRDELRRGRVSAAARLERHHGQTCQTWFGPLA